MLLTAYELVIFKAPVSGWSHSLIVMSYVSYERPQLEICFISIIHIFSSHAYNLLDDMIE